MQTIIFVLIAFISSSLFAQNGNLQSYYGNDLNSHKVTKEILNRIMTQNGYYSVGYTNARHILFGEIYVQNDNRGFFITDVYCGKKFRFNEIREVGNMHTEVNIEHTWPQSKFSRYHNKNVQKSDMHHLFLTDSKANSRRGNYDFGEVKNNHDELNVHNCDLSKFAVINGEETFEPPQSHKGNVARALFYFATRYDMTIHPAEEMILRLWHRMDPVDHMEKLRHEMIVKHQKVRNPFIDFPELVEKVADF